MKVILMRWLMLAMFCFSLAGTSILAGLLYNGLQLPFPPLALQGYIIPSEMLALGACALVTLLTFSLLSYLAGSPQRLLKAEIRAVADAAANGRYSLQPDSELQPVLESLNKLHTELQTSRDQLQQEQQGRRLQSAISQLLVNTNESSSLANRVCQVAVEYAGARAAWVVHVHDNRMELSAVQGIDPDKLQEYLSHEARSGGLRGLTQRQVITDMSVSPLTSVLRRKLPTYRSGTLFLFPLFHDGELKGVFSSIFREGVDADGTLLASLDTLADTLASVQAKRDQESQDQQLVNQLQSARQQFDQVTSISPAVLYHFSYGGPGDFRFRFVSPSVSRMTGYPVEHDWALHLWHTMIHPEDRSVLGKIDRLLHEQSEFHLEYRLLRCDQEAIWVHNHGRLVNIDGELELIGSLTDITERKKAERQLEHIAYHDPLTGLPNRLILQKPLSELAPVNTEEYEPTALMFIDLDRFKLVNDSLGHQMGDRLLKEAAERLRMESGDHDLVVRLGGDEFLVILYQRELTPEDQESKAQRRAEQIRNRLSKPYFLDEHTIYVTASIGVALFDPDTGLDNLMQYADAAMYHAKEAGRDGVRVFRSEMQDELQHQISIAAELRDAIENDQLQLFYQPQYDLESGQLIGAEALIRWMHPSEGLLPPARFIPVAEESGLITEIGQWVILESCRQLERMYRRFGRVVPLAVNISAHEIHQGELIGLLEQCLQRYSIEPEWLELEVTESSLMRESDQVMRTFDQISRLGFKVTMDDFGTGYSSLAYLKRFPIQKIKIDRSFVRDILEDQSDRAITRTIINMADGLQMKALAEGVESVEQLELLQSLGCSQGQGYYFSRPVPADEFFALLSSNNDSRPPQLKLIENV